MNAKFKPDMTRTPYLEWDDDRLMAGIGRGNQHAAHILIDRHLSYVLKICTARLAMGRMARTRRRMFSLLSGKMPPIGKAGRPK